LETGSVALFKVPRINTSSQYVYRYDAYAPPVWLACLAKTPLRPSASLVQRSRLVVPPTSRFVGPKALALFGDVTFRRLGPHFGV